MIKSDMHKIVNDSIGEDECLNWYLGDVVQLKSGGPPMTITGFTSNESGDDSDGLLTCRWFLNGGELLLEGEFKSYEICDEIYDYVTEL